MVACSGSLEDRTAGSLNFSEIARLVAANVDQDKDGNLTLAEIYNSLITRFDHDGKMGFKLFSVTLYISFIN